MALKGNLRDISIIQLLNLINLAQKSGTLSLFGDASFQMAFRGGKLIHACKDSDTLELAQVLWQSGKLSNSQAHAIRVHAQDMDEKQLGRLLVRSGYVTEEEIKQSIRGSLLDIVDELITWEDGEFHFDRDKLPTPAHITVSIDMEGVIILGNKHLKEWKRLRKELPDLDFCLRCPNKPRTRLNKIRLNPKEWRVMIASNNQRSVSQIAQANKLGAYQIRRIVYGLLKAGLVEVTRTPQAAFSPA